MSEIQKVHDGNHDEYVIVAGGIKAGEITARPVVFVDPYPTLSQESLDFSESLPTTYDFIFMARLYRSGRAYVISGDIPEEQISRVENSVEGLYDELWPDVAQQMRDFERDVIVSLNETWAEFPVEFATAAIAKSRKSFLSLLKVIEREYLAAGETDARIGWISGGASPLLSCVVPREKYRWSRAVSDVARKLNADAVVFITEAFVKSDTEPYERTGKLMLTGQFILPNGLVTHSVAGIYERVDNRLRVVAPLQETDEQRPQKFFPPWA